SCAPQNTCAAFDLAIEMGARHLELDVHFSSDAHLVVIHDDAVDRTTDGSGPVTSHSLAALTALDAGSWLGPRFKGERVPTLGAVLERYKGRAHLHVEIKGHSAGLAQRAVDLIRSRGMVAEVTITSFQKAKLEETRAYAPELPTGWLVGGGSGAGVTHAGACGGSPAPPARRRRHGRAGEPSARGRLRRPRLGSGHGRPDAPGRDGRRRRHDGELPRQAPGVPGDGPATPVALARAGARCPDRSPAGRSR